ncbi:unnamed protein product [Haemonchus placei]|uniref:LapA_dom domain-containing protein n=1 Tax=Haemonchus placei TaxID=6290 RepID=A0A0N4X5I9_HAEPC|nr:unnamed protein product [Haemonchus placei]
MLIKSQNKVDALTPFLIFFVVGFLFGIFLAFLHVRLVRSMTKSRLSSKRTEKKRKAKKSKKGKEGKGKGKEKKKGKKKK